MKRACFEKRQGKRDYFYGVVSGFVTERHDVGPDVELVKVTDVREMSTGKVVMSRCYFVQGKAWIRVKSADRVDFKARYEVNELTGHGYLTKATQVIVRGTNYYDD